MNRLLKRLPFPIKLMLIGFVPLAFLIYFAVQLYQEKSQTAALFDSYISRINESANITALIDNLQEERKFSFDYAMTGGFRKELVIQRPVTDYYITKLQHSTDPAYKGFTVYTSLDQLPLVRSQIDTAKASPDRVMHYYSQMIFRLNTLNTIPFSNSIFLKDLYQDLAAQKLLSEMITYLGIIRSNIYNVLYTKKYAVETLLGTVGTYDVYKSYEQEFLIKASPSIAQSYKNLKTHTPLKATDEYIDTLFKHFAFDSTFNPTSWWSTSELGVDELRSFQTQIWKDVNNNLNVLYERERNAQKRTILFLVVTLLLVIIVITYIIHIITQTLTQLKRATQKISLGATGLNICPESNDVIGDLATSISKIDENNRLLAEAASAIGKGNFGVPVRPRSSKDLLGNAIVQMKEELKNYSGKMEYLVAQRTEELNRSNEDLQQFAHVISHDLKEPLRKISTFSSKLHIEHQNLLSDKGKLYIDKIQNASKRMSKMIEGVLDYSVMNVNNQPCETIDLNKLLDDIKSDLEIIFLQKKATIQSGTLPCIKGIPVLMHQLFYNLISNALKFSKEGIAPIITVSATEATEKTINESINGLATPLAGTQYVHLVIKDNGIGFNQQKAEEMFHIFTRLNTHDKYEGTGLGLALCKKIVQRHHGMIFAEGKENEGACFHIILPE